MTLQVYTAQGCMPCMAVKRHLKNAGVDFEENDIAEPDNLKYVESLGFKQVPVTTYGENHVAGFNPTELNALIEIAKEDD